jgi:hypothetical protein
MLARIGALVFAHHGRGFLGDRAHLGGALAAHVEDRPHVQGADRRVRIPGAPGAVLGEHLGEALRVVGEMLERHRAILDEGDRLSVALHRHHDVEAGLADLPQRGLRAGLGHLDHAARQADVAHQLDQPLQVAQLVLALLARELDQQDRLGLADQRALDHRPEGGIGAGQLDHRAVDQLHRVGFSFTMCCADSIAL